MVYSGYFRLKSGQFFAKLPVFFGMLVGFFVIKFFEIILFGRKMKSFVFYQCLNNVAQTLRRSVGADGVNSSFIIVKICLC